MTSLLEKHRAFVLLSLSVAFVGVFLYFLRPSPLMVLEKDLYDLRFSFVHRSPAKDVVIVAVDEKSIDKLGRWPWPRTRIKELIERILASEPAVVGLDIVFSEPSNPEEDNALAETIEEAGNVVTAFFFRKESSGGRTSEESLKALKLARIKLLKGRPRGIAKFSHVEPNIPEIQAASFQSGFFNFFPDPDGLYRKIYLLAGFGEDVYPCLALSVLQAYYDEDAMVEFDPFGLKRLSLAGRFIPAEMDSSLSLNFYGPKGGFRYVSAIDVLEGRAKDLKDRIVLVGITEMGLADQRPTPVDATLPGVALHATFISNFIKGDFIVRPHWAVLWELAFLVLPPFIIIYLARYRGLFLWMGFALLVVLSEGFNIFLFRKSFINLEQLWGLFSPSLALVVAQTYRSLVLQRKAKQIKQAFSSYLAPELVEMVIKRPEMLSLGGEKRHLTCLFLDVRGFTSLSENIPPTELVNILNELLGPFTDIVLKNRGMLDKYIGDAMMALFNVPIELPDHADRAVQSAMEIMERLVEINREFASKGRPRISVGIGINTGEAVVGNMGTSVRFDYTAIGDTINLASRLEGLSKYYGVSVIISETTVNETSGEFPFLKLDMVRVKGRESPLWIYTIWHDEKLKTLYEEALERFFRRDFSRALGLLEEIGQDIAFVRLLKTKVTNALKGPLPQGWDGVTNFQVK